MNYIKQRCKQLGLTLPVVTAGGRYAPYRRIGDQLYLSGQVSRTDDEMIQGPADDSDIEKIQAAARVAALRLISVAAEALSEGEQIRLVKLNGYIMGADGFTLHAQAMNAASELLLEVLGDDLGNHARTSIGVRTLPQSGLVELELKGTVEKQ
ncbi:RidA family protein [Paenalcaligenes niemegkensis]|uniref:RidA family protein n=1 Tax=Paenalcaligenes niemegkensis TaxID=2895469 RepID=UPI001EE86879|nr:RidA family protein [Paenalcaligenes niemegkensis]MCQ9617679.1 RidA family protein [Paenalcaligenes niemegkensis]